MFVTNDNDPNSAVSYFFIFHTIVKYRYGCKLFTLFFIHLLSNILLSIIIIIISMYQRDSIHIFIICNNNFQSKKKKLLNEILQISVEITM
jgi:hypothetical protein